MKRASTTIRAYCHSILGTKRLQQQWDEIAGIQPAAGLDILTVAIASNAFTDEDLVDQMMTFLAAGHETTASALTWAVYLLAKHPKMQRRLRDEVHASQLPSLVEAAPPQSSLSSSAECSLTAELLDQMTYLNAFCRETLRLFPPVALTIRTASKDTDICGHFIPKGTTIIIPPWAVNTSRKLWGPDGREFSPERWTAPDANDNDGDDEHDDEDVVGGQRGMNSGNFAMLTFLHGPRSCIGQSFAIGELRCLLAAWVGAFETVLADEAYVPVVRGGITVKPKDGLHVRLRPLGANGE